MTEPRKEGEAPIVRPGQVFIFTLEPLLVMTAALLLTVDHHSQNTPHNRFHLHVTNECCVDLAQQHLF